VGINVICIEGTLSMEVSNQSIEQRDVRSRFECQMQISTLTRCRPARIDDNNLRATALLRGGKPLEYHRMTPGQV
jgi:hypothetical protein